MVFQGYLRILDLAKISPHQVWQMVKSSAKGRHVDHFCSELGWRNFLTCYTII